MKPFDKFEDPRRRALIQALAAGLLSATLPVSNALGQSFFGSRPYKLPTNQSIYRMQGTVTVNGVAATMKTVVRVGDTVETGKNSEVVFVVGGHSMILREDSKLVVEGANKAATQVSGLRLASGKLLTTSSGSQTLLTTSTATMNARGTGWYAECDPEKTYFCTCYGLVDISANHNAQIRETVAAKQHDRPLYILGKTAGDRAIRNAPFIDHSDQELKLVETLVGRTTPFMFPGDQYSGPRRGY